MDLQLKGRSAVVCGAETPLSQACAAALVAEGVRVVLVSTSPLPESILYRDGAMIPAACCVNADVAEPAGVEAVLDACGQPDILVNHSTGFPPGDFREISAHDWLHGVRRVMLPGIVMSTRVYDGMVERGFGRIINITSQCVKAAMDNLDVSNASRSGLTGFSAGLARYRRDADVTVNGLLPGLFDTPALRNHAGRLAAEQCRDAEDIMGGFAAQSPLGRIGVPAEFGSLCAFISSPLAGYINGQNILVDGGMYPGVL